MQQRVTSINADEENPHAYDSDEEDKKIPIPTQPRPETASFTVHVVLISLYVILWTSESLVIHGMKETDYENTSVTLAIEVFKLCVAFALFWYACPFALFLLRNNFSSYGGGGIKDLIDYADRGKLFFTLGLIYCLYNLFRYYALTIADPGN